MSQELGRRRMLPLGSRFSYEQLRATGIFWNWLVESLAFSIYPF